MDPAQLRQGEKYELLFKKIVTTMDADGPQRIVLAGESGIGKTQLARKVSEHVTSNYMCYVTLWLHLNNKFDDELSLYESIAFQIKVYNRDGKQGDDLVKDLKEKITAELSLTKRIGVREAKEWKIKVNRSAMQRAKGFEANDYPEEVKRNASSAALPYLLLILDDEGNKTTEDKVMKELGLESFLRDHAPLKVIITRRKGCESTSMSDEENGSDATYEPQDTKSDEENGSDATYKPKETKSDREIESHPTADPQNTENIEFQTTDVSDNLLVILNEYYLRDLFESLIKGKARDSLESLQKAWKIDEPLSSLVVTKSMSLPAAVVVLGKSLSSIARPDSFKRFSPKQEKVLKEVLSHHDPAFPILQLAYQLLETDDTLKNAIVDCFWHSLDFFKHCGCIHYNELITQWILEGYFDPVRSVKKAYNDGHAILVELINRGILKIQEGDMVVPEMAMSNLIDLRHHGLLGRSRLRFAKVYGGDKNKGLGKITQIDDMIRTVQAKKLEKNCTILVSGNRLRRETPEEFFEKPHMKDLEVVALFDPTLESLLQSLTKLRKLRVLVIRDYDQLTSIEELKDLPRLEVLEVSGASSMKTISDNFFEAATEIQILNLSGLGIISLPSSVSQLKKLHSLILRDCSLLEDLPDIQKLKKLEVVDVRGAHNLETCFGKGDRRKNQTFYYLRNLQLVDFSESKIKRLPMFDDAAEGKLLHSLTRLSLQNCSNLIKLPNLKRLSGLQILDLSGTTSLVDIAEVCFEQKEELKILNLSGTKFTKLPSTISELSNLRQLLLRDSSNLEVLPNITGLTSLEVFDVSGCTNLHKIEGSFKGMSYLRKVNLSGTMIETLPELPEESGICCSKLVVLADSRRFIHDTWSQIKESMSLSSSDTVDEIQEISREESGAGRVREKQLNEAWAFDCPENKGRIYRDVYMNTIPFVDTESYQEVLGVRGSNGGDQDKEALALAEFVAFVDNSAASLSSIFNALKSVKGCWLEMCRDIKILFSGVSEECLGNLETLSITNFRLMDSICSSSFKNLKKLSLDCCPSIITLFPASESPTSLEVLKIKFCVKLEKVFEEEVELRNLHTLSLFELPALSTIGAKLPNLERYNKDKCPKLESSQEDLRRGYGSDEIL